MARIAKSLDVLRAQIDKAHPQRSKLSDGWIGDPAHRGAGFAITTRIPPASSPRSTSPTTPRTASTPGRSRRSCASAKTRASNTSFPMGVSSLRSSRRGSGGPTPERTGTRITSMFRWWATRRLYDLASAWALGRAGAFASSQTPERCPSQGHHAEHAPAHGEGDRRFRGAAG